MRQLLLTEYECSAEPVAPDLAMAIVGAKPDAFELVPRAGGMFLRPTHYVGCVRVGDAIVQVSPKVRDLRSVLRMLEEAWHLLIPVPESVFLAPRADLFEILVRTLAKQVEELVRRGIRRGYVEIEEDLPVLRGRFDPEAHLARNLFRPGSLAVVYDDLTPDLLEHQLMAWTFEGLLASRRWSPDLARRLGALRAELTFGPRPHLRESDFDRVRFDRLNQRYAVPLRLCRLLVRGRSVAEATGQIPMDGFLIDMNRLFQDFVAAVLKRTLGGGLRACLQVPGRLDEVDSAGPLAVRADLVLKRGSTPVAVLDTKYREVGEGPKESEVYQVLAYARAFDVRKIGLLYPARRPEVREYRLRGRESLELRTFGVDLDEDPTRGVVELDAKLERWVTSESFNA